MVYKKFYFGLILRLIIFGILCASIGLLGFRSIYLHTLILLSILILISALELIHFLNYTNRFIANYFNSLYESGSTINFEFPTKEGSFQQLALSMEKVWNLLREARIRQEAEKEFLQNLIKQIGTGIIAFNKDGVVRIYNPMALAILNIERLHHWDQLSEINEQLKLNISHASRSEKVFVKCVINDEVRELVLYISVFKLRDELIRLVSIQDINEEMNRKEVLAWQQVIQIMAHEIMSTISPITSLSKHISQKVKPDGNVIKSEKINQSLINDISEAMEIISGRGEGLNDFISKYRSIAYLPDPNFEFYDLNEVLKSIMKLTDVEFPDYKLSFDVGKIKKVKIDKNLCEQALLNLIRNSVEALSKTKNREIILKTYEVSNAVCVDIYDQGVGIPEESLDKIFVPFFSTKEKGTGIGLSFARKVLQIHGGNISVTSNENKWTRVKLFFPDVL